jgi:hypothetical protein
MDLKKFPMDWKGSCGFACCWAVPPAADPPQPQLTFSAPLSSWNTVAVHGAPVGQVPEQVLSAFRVQVAEQEQAVQLSLPAASAAVAVTLQSWPSGQLPVHDPAFGSQVQGAEGVAVSPPPLQWHSA